MTLTAFETRNIKSKIINNLQLLFRPTIICDSVFDIDFYSLKEEGIKNIFFDVDNTLISYAESSLSIKYLNLFNEIKSYGLTITLLSNNSNYDRINTVAEQLNLPSIIFACKPLICTVRRLMKDHNMKSENTLIVGDQLHTDILLANLLKLQSVFTEPISREKISFLKKIQYKIQDKLLKYL